MPIINFRPLRRLEQHRSSSFGEKAAGRVPGAGARSCAILALLMSSVVSTGTVKAAESPEAAKQEAAKQEAATSEVAVRRVASCSSRRARQAADCS
jgi:hypothetical protein